MELLLLKKYWKHILSILLILGAILSISTTVYAWGYNNAKEECTKADKIRTDLQAKQTLAIETLSKNVSDLASKSTKDSKANLDRILTTVRNKPLFTVVDGKCTPTAEFESVYIQLSQEGNK